MSLESRTMSREVASESRAVIDAVLGWVYTVLAWTFGIVGFVFFAFPDGTVDALNAVGSWFGFPRAPHLAHRFWLSLGVAYMATVTALAAFISRSPTERRLLMLPLAVGKATSSLTCLWFFIFHDHYFVYLANFLVDASLAFLAWGTYRASEPNVPGPLSARARRTLVAIGEALLASGAGANQHPEVMKFAEAVEAQLQAQGPLALRGFEWLLWFVETSPFWFHATVRAFSELPVASRVRILEAMERSRCTVRRQAAHAVKLLFGLHAYSDPALRAELGVDDDWLATRLQLARERRERGEKGPFPEPVPVD
jgi:hypothetical protein